MGRGATGAAYAAMLLMSPCCTSARAESGIALSGNVGVVSDYRFRGVSLSGGRPALQGGVTATIGAVAFDAWASRNAQMPGQIDTEIDLSAGYEHDFGLFDAGGTIVYYSHVEHGQSNYVELLAHVGRHFGPFQLTVQGGYAPRQDKLARMDNLYGAVSGDLTIGAATAFAAIGYEHGAFAPEGKLDWQIGVKTDVQQAELSISYVDTDRGWRNSRGRRIAGPTGLVAITFGF